MIINTGTRTDIPAFYSKWFLNRIAEGFVISKNPYNNQLYKYNFNPKTVDIICFCSKNPKPLVKNLDKLSEYKQFWFTTITPYGKDIEVNVPDYKKVIKTFKALSEGVGINAVSWRYDPIFITEKYNLDFHIEKFEEMASAVTGEDHYRENGLLQNSSGIYYKELDGFFEEKELLLLQWPLLMAPKEASPSRIHSDQGHPQPMVIPAWAGIR